MFSGRNFQLSRIARPAITSGAWCAPIIAGWIFAFMTLPFAGCGRQVTHSLPTGCPALFSPDSVIAALEQAYEDKNFQEYATVFDHELYRFGFAQVDLDNDPDLPPTWRWEPEAAAASGLFDSDIVYSVRCDLSARDLAVPATEADSLGFSPLDLANTWRVHIREARVEIETNNKTGEPLILQVDGDEQEFFIKMYPDELCEGGQPIHRIVFWKDKAAGGGGVFSRGMAGSPIIGVAGVETTTWGSIKTLYWK